MKRFENRLGNGVVVKGEEDENAAEKEEDPTKVAARIAARIAE